MKILNKLNKNKTNFINTLQLKNKITFTTDFFKKNPSNKLVNTVKKDFCNLEEIRDQYAKEKIQSLIKKEIVVPDKYLNCPRNIKTALMEIEFPFFTNIQNNIYRNINNRKYNSSLNLDKGEFFLMKFILLSIANSDSDNLTKETKLLNVIICVNILLNLGT